MRGHDIKSARKTLGDMWDLGREVSRRELGDVLGFRSARPQDRIFDIERDHDEVTGPMALAMEALLDGWKPSRPGPWS